MASVKSKRDWLFKGAEQNLVGMCAAAGFDVAKPAVETRFSVVIDFSET